MYYLIVNKNTGEYYCNRSDDPWHSINAHIRRANSPESKTYNSLLHKALREQGIDNFNFFSCEQPPKWIEHLTRYMKPND